LGLLIIACSAGSDNPNLGGDGDGDASTGDGDGDSSSGDGDGDAGMDDIEVPIGDGDGDGDGDDCNPKAIGILRDFQSVNGSIPTISSGMEEQTLELCPVYRDFDGRDVDWGWQWIEPGGFTERGIVAADLGPDQKPVLADPSHDYNTIYSPESFASWYRNDPICSRSYEYELPMQQEDGKLVFDSNAFFPLDDLGFGNSGVDTANVPRNFH